MQPSINKAQAIDLLERQRDDVIALKRTLPGDNGFQPWWHRARSVVSNLFGEESLKAKEFNSISYTARPVISMSGHPDNSRQIMAYVRGLTSAEAFLNARIEEVRDFLPDSPSSGNCRSVEYLPLIFERFHTVARQLRQRYDGRPTLDISDEYDVQDLLHALLRIDFDDVRAEEWTPSYAGGSARMDFLLGDQGIVVEVKKTRKNMSAKDVGNQLLIDVARYKSHPKAKTLYCFVYDPEGLLPNPRGLERDLSQMKEGMDVKCFIRPT